MTENIPQKYTYQDDEFLVNASKGCYLEVAFKEQVGFVGVNLQGTREYPYCWHTTKSVVTDDGLKTGHTEIGGIKDNLNRLCQELVALQRVADARKAFDREEACKQLHDFFKELGE